MKVKEHEVQGEPGGGLTRVWARGAEKKEHEHQAQATPRAAFRSVIPSSRRGGPERKARLCPADGDWEAWIPGPNQLAASPNP